MLVAPDRRRLEFEILPDLLREAAAEARSRRKGEIRLAQRLLTIDEQKAYVASGAASAFGFAVGLGLAEPEAATLLRLGRVLGLRPELEGLLLEGKISSLAAATVEPLLADPSLAAEHDDWIEHAMRLPYARLRRKVRRRIAQLRAGEPVVSVTVHVKDSVEEDFRLCRDIASDKAGRFLTLSETFEVVVDHYLRRFDPARRGTRRRRVEHTALRPDDRYIPSDVRREIRLRSGRTCEFPGCRSRLFLQMAHLNGKHAEGGSREEDNLLLLCREHHILLDGGYFTARGMADDPEFVDPHGRVFSRRSPRGRAADGCRAAAKVTRDPPPDAVRSPAPWEHARRDAAGGAGRVSEPCGAALAGRDPPWWG